MLCRFASQLSVTGSLSAQLPFLEDCAVVSWLLKRQSVRVSPPKGDAEGWKGGDSAHTRTPTSVHLHTRTPTTGPLARTIARDIAQKRTAAATRTQIAQISHAKALTPPRHPHTRTPKQLRAHTLHTLPGRSYRRWGRPANNNTPPNNQGTAIKMTQ